MSELLLNQFEQDRALVALRYKNLNIRKLFGKSVFIAGGGELAFSLVSSLRMVNLKKQAGIAVFLLVEDNESYDRSRLYQFIRFFHRKVFFTSR